MTIPEEKRAQIIVLRGRGVSWSEVAQQLGIGVRTAQRWWNRAQLGEGLTQKKIPGRPRSTTPEEDAQITQLAEREADMTTERVRQLVIPNSVHLRTVQRRIFQLGLRMLRPRIKELKLQDPKVRRKRLDWAFSEQVKFGDNFWNRVWVDECTVSTDTYHKTRVRAKKGTGKFITHFRMRCGRKSVSIFGGMCGDELLPLYVVSKKFDSPQYTDVLNELYWPVLQSKFGGAEFSYQQDNSPVHRGKIVREWLETVPEFGEKINFQPPYSPDLNPIEHVWKRLKTILSGRFFYNTDQLTQALIRGWDHINQHEKNFLRSLTSSMSSRLRAVVEAEGGPTKY